MINLQFRLFARILSRNYQAYLLKLITLAVAFATSTLIILFSTHEFGYDRFHANPGNVFRILQKNTDEHYSGNRLSVKIPAPIIHQLTTGAYRDSLLLTRVKVMNQITIQYGNQVLDHASIHAADTTISQIFQFDIVQGNLADFTHSTEPVVMLSRNAAIKYTGTPNAAGKRIRLYTLGDTLDVHIAAVFKNFPKNSHTDFEVFLTFNTDAINTLHFNAKETGVYGRARITTPTHYNITQSTLRYSLQPLPDIYFGPRVLCEEARHGDRYSIIIIICTASLILFLALTSFINLTTITLPHRAKELAVKKLAGTSYEKLLFEFAREYLTLVSISLGIGILIIAASHNLIAATLGIAVVDLIQNAGMPLLLITILLVSVFVASPVLMTWRFVRATPTRLLSTEAITFQQLKAIVTFLQFGITIFLITTSVVIRRQINYSLVKEPGQNHDQIIYLSDPTGLTREGIAGLRDGWRKYHPNILDVMAVSQLPDRIHSKEIGAEFYLLGVDPGFKEFFNLRMESGHWFDANTGDSSMVINKRAALRVSKNNANTIGVVQDLAELFNQPEKPVKIKLARDYNYNWLCIRVLEVDIRRTVAQLSRQFSSPVYYFDPHFEYWINYQDRLNRLSDILTLISALLSCFAMYGLSVSLVHDKLKEIAVHKLFGAETFHITYLLAMVFIKQLFTALIVFAPITYILLSELLRVFAFATPFSWLDPVYPIAYCIFVVVAICGFQAISLNRANFVSALKG